MKIRKGIEVFSISIEKVWKIVFENVWEPCLLCFQLCLASPNAILTRRVCSRMGLKSASAMLDFVAMES